MAVSALSTTDEDAWDDFALANGGCFLQSWGWSQFQEAAGNEVFRVRLDEHDGDQRTTAQFLVVALALPMGQRVSYVPRGPLVLAGEGKARFRASLSAVLDAARRQGSLFARLEPPMPVGEGPVTADDLRGWGLEATRHVAPDCTSVVDLARGEGELLAAMHQKTRYNIRVAERNGVVVSEAEYANAHLLRHDTEVFWRLLSATAERDAFSLHPRGYYEKMVEVLNPRHRRGNALAVRLFFASHEGVPVAAGLFAEYGDTVTYLHGASLSAKRQVMAPHLLHWEVMRDAKRRGFKKYDFWGVAPEDARDGHPWAGITRFKVGFGGARVSYHGTWEMPVSRIGYGLYRLVNRTRGK